MTALGASRGCDASSSSSRSLHYLCSTREKGDKVLGDATALCRGASRLPLPRGLTGEECHGLEPRIVTLVSVEAGEERSVSPPRRKAVASRKGGLLGVRGERNDPRLKAVAFFSELARV